MQNKRLEKVANLISNVNVLADIGTDHGYLPIELVKSKKVNFVYAADINEKPLNSAKSNIKNAGLDNSKIETILSNGISFINERKLKVDIVTITGLGTSTMIDIIENDSPYISEYIFCSNTEVSSLREWSNKNNFSIKKEDFFLDNNKKYWLIWIDKKNNHKVSNTLLGDFVELKNNLEYIKYLNYEIKKYENIISKITNDNSRMIYFENLVNQIKEYINEIG
ncbi:tRNA (adenine(22)-N(1))-methyltransferase [Mesoplasma photuris]|uniref:tRNA (adenine(22)-N(1))-methyltransferase n=1 Tax=Mesoplasma photuris TaxID=217731 RepID=UPI0004E1F46D|nr:class I SAM-dependent methyltransferase [Mesoplasma photuris]